MRTFFYIFQKVEGVIDAYVWISITLLDLIFLKLNILKVKTFKFD